MWSPNRNVANGNRSCTTTHRVRSMCSQSARSRSQFDQVIMRSTLANAITYSCRLNHPELMSSRLHAECGVGFRGSGGPASLRLLRWWRYANRAAWIRNTRPRAFIHLRPPLPPHPRLNDRLTRFDVFLSFHLLSFVFFYSWLVVRRGGRESFLIYTNARECSLLVSMLIMIFAKWKRILSISTSKKSFLNLRACLWCGNMPRRYFIYGVKILSLCGLIKGPDVSTRANSV